MCDTSAWGLLLSLLQVQDKPETATWITDDASISHHYLNPKSITICVCVLGVARYTDVMVRYVPRFGGHGSIRFRYNMKKKKSTMLGLFSFILNRQ